MSWDAGIDQDGGQLEKQQNFHPLHFPGMDYEPSMSLCWQAGVELGAANLCPLNRAGDTAQVRLRLPGGGGGGAEGGLGPNPEPYKPYKPCKPYKPYKP